MDMPQNQDFKYVLQDFGNIYIGARYSYEEMLKSEEIPYKWKAIIRHYLLKETSPETTMENHIFFMKEDDFAYETFQELKASFKMSGHYESREYKISEIVQSEELHRKMDTIIVEELHLTKLALMMFSV